MRVGAGIVSVESGVVVVQKQSSKQRRLLAPDHGGPGQGDDGVQSQPPATAVRDDSSRCGFGSTVAREDSHSHSGTNEGVALFC